MSKRLLNAAIAAALVALAFVAFAIPASAQQRTLRVRLATGSVIVVTVDAPCVPMSQIPGLPGTPVEDLTPSSVCPGASVPTPPPTQTTPPAPPQQPQQGGNGGGGSSRPHSNGGSNRSGDRPSTSKGHKQGRTRSHAHANPNTDPQAEAKARKKHKRRSDGVPTPHNPTFFDALPGPAGTSGVPNFVIQKFKVP